MCNIMLDHSSVVFRHVEPGGIYFGGFKSFAILAVANFANINSNEYFCPVGYLEYFPFI